MHKLWWMKTPLFDKKTDGDGEGDGGGDGKDEKTKFVTDEEFGRTAAKIRGLEKTITSLTSAVNNGLTVDKLVEIGLFEKGEDGTITLKSSAKPPDGKKGEAEDERIVKLQNQINDLTKQSEELKKQSEEKDKLLAEEKKTSLSKRIAAEAVSALSKLNALNPQRDVIHITPNVKYNEADDSLYVVTKDKFGNETNISIEDYASEWLKKNPELMKVQTMSGSGTPGTGTSKGGSTNGGKVIPYDQWTNMDWFSQNRDKFTSGEFVRGDKPGATA